MGLGSILLSSNLLYKRLSFYDYYMLKRQAITYIFYRHWSTGVEKLKYSPITDTISD